MLLPIAGIYRRNLGQTYIEVLIAIGILGILTAAVFVILSSSYELVGFSRSRVTALHLAEQKIEIIRNMPYDQIGTVGGIPPGPLAQVETAVLNGLSYTIRTTIIYVDDPFDGVAPVDLLPTDYKRIRVEVSWQGLAKSAANPVVFVSDISPKGLETSSGGGTISILVIDSNAVPVSGATITISASLNPPIDITLTTGEDGRILLPGAPSCNSCYRITASKNGYSQDRTYSIEEVANPDKPDLSIIEGQVSEVSFAIDKVSTLTVKSVSDRESNFAVLPTVSFTLRGQKIIGKDTQDQPVYKYNQLFSTNESGEITINNLEWDNYIAIPSASYDISGTNPLSPIKLLANSTQTFTISLSSHTSNTLLVSFLDSNHSPVSSVSATLSDGAGFNSTKLSGISSDPDFGQVFFKSLSELSYHLHATVSGFLDNDSDIPVSGQTQVEVILTAQ